MGEIGAARLLLVAQAFAFIALVALPASAQSSSAPDGSPPLTILFHNDPPSGDSMQQTRPLGVGVNRFKVLVKDASGKRVNDAAVSVTFAEPRAGTAGEPIGPIELEFRGSGIYRGTAFVPSSGPWSATIVVRRGAEQLGTRTLMVESR